MSRLPTDRPEENWAVYMSAMNDKSAVIAVDLGLRGIVPVASHPNLFVAKIAIKRPREDGLFQLEEADEILYPLENALIAAIQTDDTKAVNVGKITHDGVISHYFYAPLVQEPRKHGFLSQLRSKAGQGEPTLRQLAEAVSHNFPGYEVQCSLQSDPSWSRYLDVLYPDDWELQRIANANLVDLLRKQGDDTSKPREIDHFIICDSEDVQDEIIKRCEAEGFRAVPSRSDSGDYCVTLYKDSAPDNIDYVIWPLFQISLERGALYDGWGALPVKN